MLSSVISAKPEKSISPPRREANGDRQRASRKERDAARRAKLDAEKNTVKAQRMAIGATEANWQDQRWQDALGRFTLRNKLPSELYLAGEKFQSDNRRYRLLKGLPTTGGNGAGSTEDPSPELIDRLQKAVLSAIAYVDQNEGPNRTSKIRALCLDNTDIIDPRASELAVWGLEALAVHYGMMR